MKFGSKFFDIIVIAFCLEKIIFLALWEHWYLAHVLTVAESY